MNAPELLNKITRIRGRQVPLIEHAREEGRALLVEQLTWCASWLHFREWHESQETRLVNANFCKKYLLCPCCAARRSTKLVEAYLPKVEQVIAARPDLRAVMITLTIKNGHNLQERFDHLRSSWSSMVAARRKSIKSKERHAPIQWNSVEGGIKSMETTYDPIEGWHVHLHILALITDWIDPFKLSAEWRRFTGDSFIVDVRLCKPNPRRPESSPVREGVVETFGYICKFGDLTPSQRLDFFDTASGSRMVDSFGCLRGVKVESVDHDSDFDAMRGPFRDFLALWFPGADTYQIKDVEARPMILERPGHSPRVMGSGSKPICSARDAAKYVALASFGKLKTMHSRPPEAYPETDSRSIPQDDSNSNVSTNED